MSAPKVFISYSHDSDEHRERVLALSERLRADGLETILDQYLNGSPLQGWPRWMLDQIDAANSILVVCTETYYRRFRGHEEPGKGKGGDWEGALITQEIYDGRSRTLKFIPVFLSAVVNEWIPEPLRSVNYYALTSESGYQSLYDFLLEQAGVEPGQVGTLKPRVRPKGKPLTFTEEPQTHSVRADISRIVKYAPAELIGREDETKLLNDAWDQAVRGETKRPHVLTFVALGGEGKTSLVAKWAADLAHEGWPGCEAVFAWSFYHQGTDEKTADSSDLFLKEALTFFGDPAMADSAEGAYEKGRRLAQLVGERRALIILDGVEPLQYSPTSPTAGEIKDAGLSAVLKGLAAINRGLCLVTTRYSIQDLKAFWQTTAPEEPLLRLSKESGVHLLLRLGVRKESATKAEFEKLVEDVKGHALTLNLLGTYLHDAHAGDIRKRDLVKLEEADAEEQAGHAFRVMDAYVRWFESEGEKGKRAIAVLRLLGLFDRPATAECLTALHKSPFIPQLTETLVGINEAQSNVAFARLQAAKLITVNRDATGALVSLDAHPHLREYFARQLRTQQPDAWLAAHRRLYEHLCATTDEGDQPTLEDLQPLYQAVAHGCQAGLQQEACDRVFFNRIRRGNEDYAAQKLGAFGSELGAVACFLDKPWKFVSPALTEADRSWLLVVAAFDLRALGRLGEALQPMRAGLEIEVNQERWQRAAQAASNLSELELTLGEVAEAVRDAEQSVTYADRSGDAGQRLVKRTTHADALLQAGRRAEAETRFREAEQIQKDDQPDYPLLYSLQGFRFCDLLLAAPERVTWQVTLELKTKNLELETSIELSRAVSQRATQTLKWMQADSNAPLLTLALDHLTLGRAAFYEVVLAMGGLPFKTQDSELKTSIDAGVAGLRRAGQAQELPRGLLTRAWLRLLTGAHTGSESAQEDLDEAWEIAERGPMRLHMVDIHLYRARLFGAMKDEGGSMKYPWDRNPDGTSRGPKDDLAAARKLIEQCGYWRRKEELEDAEEAAKGW